MENPLKMVVLMGKSSINGPFPMAMLNNQRVSDNLKQKRLMQFDTSSKTLKPISDTMRQWHHLGMVNMEKTNKMNKVTIEKSLWL